VLKGTERQGHDPHLLRSADGVVGVVYKKSVVAVPTSRTLVFLLWLLGAAVALALSIFCIMGGSNGKISALALIPFVWTVALLAGALESLPRRRARLRPWPLARSQLLTRVRDELPRGATGAI
jgi:hypothetical protein